MLLSHHLTSGIEKNLSAGDSQAMVSVADKTSNEKNLKDNIKKARKKSRDSGDEETKSKK